MACHRSGAISTVIHMVGFLHVSNNAKGAKKNSLIDNFSTTTELQKVANIVRNLEETLTFRGRDCILPSTLMLSECPSRVSSFNGKQHDLY